MEIDDLNEYVNKFVLCLDNTVEHFTIRSRVNREKGMVLRRDKIIYYKKAIMENMLHIYTMGGSEEHI